MLQERSNPGTKRRRALLGVALARRGRRRSRRGRRLRPRRRSRIDRAGHPDAPRERHRDGHAHPHRRVRVEDKLTIGDRPNVIRAFGDNVFVGSFRQQRLRIVSAKTGKVRSFAPKIGVGVNDGAFGFGSLWLAVGRARPIVRLDQRTGRPRGNPISVPGPPGAVAASRNAIWVALVPGKGAADRLLKLDPKSRRHTLASVDYPTRDRVAHHQSERALGRRPTPRADPAREPAGRARPIKELPRRQQPQ